MSCTCLDCCNGSRCTCGRSCFPVHGWNVWPLAGGVCSHYEAEMARHREWMDAKVSEFEARAKAFSRMVEAAKAVKCAVCGSGVIDGRCTNFSGCHQEPSKPTKATILRRLIASRMARGGHPGLVTVFEGWLLSVQFARSDGIKCDPCNSFCVGHGCDLVAAADNISKAMLDWFEKFDRGEA